MIFLKIKVVPQCLLLCCSTPRSETHLPPRCSRASVYPSTCAGWHWADYRIRGTARSDGPPPLCQHGQPGLTKDEAQHNMSIT